MHLLACNGTQELVRSHEIEVDVATSFADFDAAVSGIDSEPAAEISEWNRCVPAAALPNSTSRSSGSRLQVAGSHQVHLGEV